MHLRKGCLVGLFRVRTAGRRAGSRNFDASTCSRRLRDRINNALVLPSFFARSMWKAIELHTRRHMVHFPRRSGRTFQFRAGSIHHGCLPFSCYARATPYNRKPELAQPSLGLPQDALGSAHVGLRRELDCLAVGKRANKNLGRRAGRRHLSFGNGSSDKSTGDHAA
jgi:hypothetical protein